MNGNSVRARTAPVMHGLPCPPDLGWLESLPYRDSVELGAYDTAPRTARRRLASLLWEWSLREFEDVASLVLSELVTNGVVATSLVPWTAARPPVRVWLRGGLSVVAILAWDASPDAPVPRAAGMEDESGRGLALVENLSAAWGFYRPAHFGGKVTWSVIDTP
jgi:serine/threonine-protein kinase RsbW